MGARRLEVGGIIATAERLAERVADRFGERSLRRIADEVVDLGHETQARLERAEEPDWRVRAGTVGVILLGLVVLGLSASRVRLGSEIEGIDEWLAVIQTAIQDVVFLGVAVAFLLGLEARRRRRVLLAGLHELRSVAHVIDMHQLTKDPATGERPEQRTEHSPTRDLDRFELGRYLDYCSELLSLTSKLAALYAQATDDAPVLAAVREIEDLTAALSSKVWQKIMILDSIDGPAR